MTKPTNLNYGKLLPVFHGENFFQPVDTLPAGTTKKLDSYIAGHSETGHHHILKSKGMEVLETNGERYVAIKEVAELFHQKSYDIHETQHLAPGVYKITHKSEYDPFQKVKREVWD